MNVSSLHGRPAAGSWRRLEGEWQNQLGSKLTIEVDDGGRLRGTYSPSETSVTMGSHPLVGFCSRSPSEVGTVLGFVVSWDEVHSLTVWSGQYHAGDDVIRATWLMTSETVEEDDWRSTMIGHDVFHRL